LYRDNAIFSAGTIQFVFTASKIGLTTSLNITHPPLLFNWYSLYPEMQASMVKPASHVQGCIALQASPAIHVFPTADDSVEEI